MSSIYLIHEREFINKNVFIIKLGRTNSIIKRYPQYPKGSRLIFALYTNSKDLVQVENALLHKFRDVFKARTDIGKEYFEGDVDEMINIIVTHIKYNEKTDEKEEEICIKKDPTIALIDFVNENYKLYSKNVVSSKHFYNEFLEYIKMNNYDLHVTHTKMSHDLSKCFGVKNTVLRFDNGVEQGLYFPDLIEEPKKIKPKLKEKKVEPDVNNNRGSKHELYRCIRCNYSTERKSNMYYHLYKIKKPCPATENIIHLTDEIKQHIMDNRIYKIVENP